MRRGALRCNLFVAMNPNPVLCLLVLSLVTAASAQNSAQCRALAAALTSVPHCSTAGDDYCNEIECFNPSMHARLSFYSCEDPPEVELSLGNGDPYSDGYWSHTFAVRAEEATCDMQVSYTSADRIQATFSRNASHINFQATAVIGGDVLVTVIPAVALPMDLSSCTCYGLYVANDYFQLGIPNVTPSCYVNDSTTCTDFRCGGITSGGSRLVSDAVIDPCTESVTVTVTNVATGARVWRQVFTHDSSVQLTTVPGYTPTLYVLITHYNYSMNVSVKLSLYGTYNSTVIRPTTIVLDRSSCSRPIEFPGAPFPYGSSDGCLNDPVDYQYYTEPEPYPSFPDYPFPSDYPTGYPPYTFPYPPYTFPTNYPRPPTGYPYGPSDSTTGQPHVQQHARTCQALQNIAQGSAYQCSVVDSCTALSCNVAQYNAKLTIETCNNPPAVGVVIRDAFGNTLVDETLVNSRTEPIQFGDIHVFDLHITIKHVENPDSLILKVSIHTVLGQDFVIIPDTSIPIDRCGCPGIACTNDNSGGGTGDNTAGKHSSNLVKIVVPVGVVVLLLIVLAVAVAVVVGVVFAKKKRGGAYNFQRMSFNTASEDMEEES